MIVEWDKPVGEENIDEPGGKASLGCQISTLHHFMQLGKKMVHHRSRSKPILVALDLMPAKKRIMSNTKFRFKLASGVREVQQMALLYS